MHKFILIITLIACSFLLADWHVNEGFENGAIPQDWTVYAGQQGAEWSAYENADYAWGGNWAAFSDSYFPENEDNWLILPQSDISDGDSLSLYIRSWFSTEIFEIFVSTESAAINDFDYQLIHVDEQNDQYTLYSFDMSDFAGQSVYIGLHWYCDNYGLLVDNVKLGQGENLLPQINLPDSFSFVQGQQLAVDFTQFISNASPQSATVTATDYSYIDIDIDSFLVTFNSLNWSGSQQITFTLEDDQGHQDSDEVLVIVEQGDVFDLQLQAINSPGMLSCINEQLFPAVAVANNGNTGTGDLNLSLYCQITAQDSSLVYSSQQEIDLNLLPQEALLIDFITGWIPENEGDYVVTAFFEIDDAALYNNSLSQATVVREHFPAGGPDDFGYQWLDNHLPQGPQFNWIDISQTGESAVTYNVSQFAGDDNFSEFIPFGFDFNFYGINYSQFSVDINGEILLADNSWFEPYPSNGWDNDGNVFNWAYPIPGYSQMPALIAVFWDDLQADEGTGDVYFQTFGDAPDRYCVIQWHNIRFHTGDNLQQYLQFETIIHENGDILMQYQNTATGQTGSSAPHDYGQSATVAIQNEAADMGLTYLQEIVEGSSWAGVEPEGNILTNGLAIRFFTGEDNTPPFITHSCRGNTLLSEIQLSAQISDMSGLDNQYLMIDRGNGWQQITNSSFNEPNIYNYTISNLMPGESINYYFTATDASENANSAMLPANAPDEYYNFKVLPYQDNSVLLAYSGYQDYTNAEFSAWQQTLDYNGVVYDTYNWQEWQDLALPDQYSAIYLFSNSCSHSDELDTLCVRIMDWLDTGSLDNPKNIFLASDGFAYSQSAHPNSSPMKKLLNAYFRTSYVGTTIGGGTNGLGGPNNPLYQEGSFAVWTDSPLGNTGEEIAVYANSPDCIFRYEACPSWYEDEVINPEIGAINAFVFEDGPYNGQAYLYHGVCGTAIDNLIYKAFLFSFDLSQITDDNSRNELIADCCDWFDITVDQDQNEIAPPAVVLQQNFPNPFITGNMQRSATTVINFSCDNASLAQLNIYNIKGRKIASLAKQLSAQQNQYSFVWDGKDKDGALAASGVYLYQLFLDERPAAAKKMILLR